MITIIKIICIILFPIAILLKWFRNLYYKTRILWAEYKFKINEIYIKHDNIIIFKK